MQALLGVSANAQVTIGAGATNVTYAPPADFSGADTFNYVIADGQGGFATGRVDVVVTVAWRQSSRVAAIDSAAYDMAVGRDRRIGRKSSGAAENAGPSATRA